jgi:putative ABC transport system permease protein
METLWEDLRLSLRSLRRKPLFALVAIFTLALGIGANTAMFSVIHAVLLRPLPYAEPERLVRIYSAFEGRLCCTISAPNFVDMRGRTRQFEDLVAYSSDAFSITGGTEPVRLSGYQVSSGLFEMLGASPQVGRFISVQDDRFGSEPVVVLADRLWRDRFAADPGVIGKSLTIDSRPHTIIGVAPQGFRITGQPQLFVPFAWDPDNMPSREANSLNVIGRAGESSSIDAAMAELDSIYADLVAQYPDNITNKGVAERTLSEWLIGESRRRPLLVLWGAVAMVLLVACANVVNLVLARAESRQRELAVRAALGAGRGRLIRHFLTESLLVSFTGAAVGIAGAFAGLRLLLARFGGSVPRSDGVALNPQVLMFAIAVCLLTGVVVGLVPALQTRSRQLEMALRDGGRGSAGKQSRLRRALVVVEVGAALILVVGAGLMLKSFYRLNHVDVGVDASAILTVGVSLPPERYPDTPEGLAFFESFRDAVKRIPGVEDAGLINAVPFSGTYNNFSQVIPVGDPETIATFVEARTASPDFFASLGTRLLQGRVFNEADHADAPTVVVVNRELVRQILPDGNPVGRLISPGAGAPEWEVIGVVEDLREHGPDEPPAPTIYFGHLQGLRNTMSLTVRTTGDPLDIVPEVRRIARGLDPELPLFGINRLDQLIYDGLGSRRFSMSLLSLFAGLALMLGAVGIYGVMAYTVAQRTREIGLRQALGASPRAVLGTVVAQGFRMTGAGIALGLLGAFLLRRVMGSLLLEVGSLDPAVYLAVAGLLSLVALLACIVPARRAARIDPMVALRDE